MKFIKTEDGVDLHIKRWPLVRAAKGTVLIVHGLGEHIDRYTELAAHLNEWGWSVFGYDQRGHGASGGARGDTPNGTQLLEDLALVIDELRSDRQFLNGPLVMLGHSMGGLVASRFVASSVALEPDAAVQPLPRWVRQIDALVLSSPALDPGMNLIQQGLLAVAGPLAPHLAVGNGLKVSWISRDAAVVSAYTADPLVHDRITPTLARMILDGGQFVRQRAAQWLVPTLLIWAGADRCVNPAGSAAFAEMAPRSRLTAHCFEGLYHEIFNEPEKAQVFHALQSWLEQHFVPITGK